MRTHVEFRSSLFPPYQGEEEEINPGRYGKRLAEYLALELRRRGFDVGESSPEDWGWVVPIRNEGFPLWVGCSNYEEWPDGYLCFIEPRKPRIRRGFRTFDTTAVVGRLADSIDEVFRIDPGIRDVRWWTEGESGA